MNSSQPNRPRAKHLWFDGDLLRVELEDGRVLAVRYGVFPRLAKASRAQRNNWKLIGRGVGIHWPAIDEDLSTDGLLRDAISLTSGQAEAS